jgi:hypothetical protein
MRSIIVLLLASSPSFADERGPAQAEPSNQARIDVATSIELANGKRWKEALAILDRVVTEQPTWSEGYFLRAGVVVNMIGDAASLDQLSKPRRGVNYEALARSIDRAVSDLDAYLKYEPETDVREDVLATMGTLRARSIAARSAQHAIDDEIEVETVARLAEHESAIDAVGQPLAMVPLAARRRVEVALGGAFVSSQPETPSTNFVNTVSLSGEWAARSNIVARADMSLSTSLGVNDNTGREGVGLGNFVFGGTWLRDQRAGGSSLRIGTTLRAGLGSVSHDDVRELAMLAHDAASPLAFAPGSGIELAAGTRVSWGDLVGQAELAGGPLLLETTEWALRASVGGGVRIWDRYMALVTWTSGTGTSLPWLGDDALVSQLALGVAHPRVSAMVTVPFDGPIADQRGASVLFAVAWTAAQRPRMARMSAPASPPTPQPPRDLPPQPPRDSPPPPPEESGLELDVPP